MKISYNEYKGMLLRIMQFENERKRKPNYVILKGIKIKREQYEDMINRVKKFIETKGRTPKAVEVKVDSIPPTSIPKVITELQAVLGGKFTNLTQLYHLVKNNVYAHYLNDKYNYTTELKRLNKHIGLNCADFSQIGMHAIKGLNQMGLNYNARYVHVKCRDKYGRPNPKAGHFFLQVIGGEFKTWTNVDFAEAASGKKPIGTTMCMHGYAVSSYNDSQLLVDDGR
jgi:hypothetical protein